MKNNFRQLSPTRTCTKTYARYTSFKPYLAKDFNNRCGYTDSSDLWFGGKNNFHIDHFIPWKKHPDDDSLKLSYANMVYTCSYVNILKSDDEGPYIDPCNVDFNVHFERDEIGNIIPIADSVNADYMYKKLRLYLKRYQIIWMLDNLFEKMNKLQNRIDRLVAGDLKSDLLKIQGELAGQLLTYLKYLKAEQ